MSTKAFAKEWFCFKPQAKYLGYANLHPTVKMSERATDLRVPSHDQV